MSANRVVIIGKRGRLGAALARELAASCSVTALGREGVDLAAPVPGQLAGLEFDTLINCAAATNVDWCERNPHAAMRVNADAVGELAELCTRAGARLIHISTDYVFSGETPGPLSESSPTGPVNRYGESKLHGENAVLAAGASHLVIRVSWVFGPDRPSFIDQIVRQALREDSVAAIDDKWSAPTYTLDFADWLRPILANREIAGILHLCNAGACSWRQLAEVALEAARRRGLPVKAGEVKLLTLAGMKAFVAKRPVHTVLSTDRFRQLTGFRPRPWEESVAAYVQAQDWNA